jgi:hypothetical protein
MTALALFADIELFWNSVTGSQVTDINNAFRTMKRISAQSKIGIGHGY